MIVVDLDGTIINQNKKISTTTKSYLKSLKEKGYTVVIATGRAYQSAYNVTEGAEFANYIISDTGACIYDCAQCELILETVIDKTTIEAILQYYTDRCNYICVCDHHVIYKYADVGMDVDIIKVTKDKEYILDHCKAVSHIAIDMKSNEEVLSLYEKLKQDISTVNFLVMQDSYNDRKWIEAIPKGISKYNSIQKLAKHLNIYNEDIIAFGDGFNDMDMLEKCGYGVALKNALPEVQKVANDVTKYDYNDDGVIRYLKEYLKDE